MSETSADDVKEALRLIENRRAYWSKPSSRARMSRRMRAQWRDPKWRAYAIKRMRGVKRNKQITEAR
jgi:hypothetical protein